MKIDDMTYIYWYYKGWISDLFKNRKLVSGIVSVAAGVAIAMFVIKVKGG